MKMEGVQSWRGLLASTHAIKVLLTEIQTYASDSCYFSACNTNPQANGQVQLYMTGCVSESPQTTFDWIHFSIHTKFKLSWVEFCSKTEGFCHKALFPLKSWHITALCLWADFYQSVCVSVSVLILVSALWWTGNLSRWPFAFRHTFSPIIFRPKRTRRLWLSLS